MRQLYLDLASDDKAGPVIAWNYVSGIGQFIAELATFPYSIGPKIGIDFRKA